jgi:hypothetical protein
LLQIPYQGISIVHRCRIQVALLGVVGVLVDRLTGEVIDHAHGTGGKTGLVERTKDNLGTIARLTQDVFLGPRVLSKKTSPVGADREPILSRRVVLMPLKFLGSMTNAERPREPAA